MPIFVGEECTNIPFLHPFNYALLLFPKGLKNKEPDNAAIFLNNTAVRLIEYKKLDGLQIEFSINSNLRKIMTRGSEFLLFSQVCVNKEANEYWPSQRGKSRYHGYKFNATNDIEGTGKAGAAKFLAEISNTVMNDYLGGNIRIGTPKEIKNWK